jgi:two-component system cell cycle response regulator
MVGDREKMLAAGFDGYIPGPIDPEAFVPEVEALLHPTHIRSHHSVLPLAVEPPTRPINPATATILAVDNSTVNLSLMQITLEPFGYHVICVYDASEALTLMRQTPPDLILSDGHMPYQDGYALIKAVKADPQLRAIPFAFISSTLWPEKEREIGLALGAVKFIVRPIGLQVLLAAIEKRLQ